jgi:hypothetical protein
MCLMRQLFFILLLHKVAGYDTVSSYACLEYRKPAKECNLLGV